MGGKSGAGLSRRGISGFVKGLWRTCDILSRREEGEEEQFNMWCVAGMGEWRGLMTVCMMFRRFDYLFTTKGGSFFLHGSLSRLDRRLGIREWDHYRNLHISTLYIYHSIYLIPKFINVCVFFFSSSFF